MHEAQHSHQLAPRHAEDQGIGEVLVCLELSDREYSAFMAYTDPQMPLDFGISPDSLKIKIRFKNKTIIGRQTVQARD